MGEIWEPIILLEASSLGISFRSQKERRGGRQSKRQKMERGQAENIARQQEEATRKAINETKEREGEESFAAQSGI